MELWDREIAGGSSNNSWYSYNYSKKFGFYEKVYSRNGALGTGWKEPAFNYLLGLKNIRFTRI